MEAEKKAKAGETDARRLVRFVEALTRIAAERADPQAARCRCSEVDRAEAQAGTLEDFGDLDLVAIARGLQEDAGQLRTDLSEELGRLKGERCDVARRRNELAALAPAIGWPLEHRDKKDSVGPFVLSHSPAATVVSIGGVSLAKLGFPSGRELVEILGAKRAELEGQLAGVADEIRTKALPMLGKGPDAFVTWKGFAAVMGLDSRSFRRREGVFLFFLGSVRAKAIPGWKLEFHAPTLTQQEEAFDLPRMDRAGAVDRIYEFRLEATEQ